MMFKDQGRTLGPAAASDIRVLAFVDDHNKTIELVRGRQFPAL